MGAMKTPGVYIVEKNAFPNSVVEVATAVPAFIGHTEKADNGGKTLLNKPWRITSMAEFHNYYGGAPHPLFEISELPKAEAAAPADAKASKPKPDSSGDTTVEPDFSVNGRGYTLKQTNTRFLLYYGMLLFFQNGGGPCYIVSIGNYNDDLDPAKMKKGVKQLIKEQEPTMVLIPEAVSLEDSATCIGVQQASLQHCGNKMRNRISVLDIYDGYKDRQDPSGDCVAGFRNALGINYLDYTSAYYPWVNTTIIQDNDLSFFNIANLDKLKEYLNNELVVPMTAEKGAIAADDPDKDAKNAKIQEIIDSQTKVIDDLASAVQDAPEATMLNKTLFQISPLFIKVMTEIKNNLNLLPPSAAMAGVYTMVDNLRGVWKAPANVSLNSVVSPAVNISHDDQEDLNVAIHGKSINAIRSFIGEGVLVWGARTLDGNSLDWRYINVRRTMIMLEESIKLATKAYVFENNNANTWVTIKSMISNFLTGIWKRGGLAGTSPDDAFSVSVGLGETMTPDDILEGILRVTVLVAITRPAEFIEITFQQQMQKS